MRDYTTKVIEPMDPIDSYESGAHICLKIGRTTTQFILEGEIPDMQRLFEALKDRLDRPNGDTLDGHAVLPMKRIAPPPPVVDVDVMIEATMGD